MLCHRIRAQNKRRGHGLRERDLLATAKKRRSVDEQGLHLFAYDVDEGLHERVFLCALGFEDLEPVATGLGGPSVGEEVDAGAG